MHTLIVMILLFTIAASLTHLIRSWFEDKAQDEHQDRIEASLNRAENHGKWISLRDELSEIAARILVDPLEGWTENAPMPNELCLA